MSQDRAICLVQKKLRKMQPTCSQFQWTHPDGSNPQHSAPTSLSALPVHLMCCMNSSTACKWQDALPSAHNRHDELG